MVERLKQAIEKARLERQDAPATGAAVRRAIAPTLAPAAAWSALSDRPIDAETLRRARIVTSDKSDPAFVTFDIMRTRIMQTCRDKGWRRIGVTSATKGCGKTFVTLNLAFSLARNAATRCVVIDLDLRSPAVGRSLGLRPEATAPAFLSGAAPLEAAAVRVRPNLAILCGARAADSAELIQSQEAAAALDALQARLNPDIILMDLPPVLVGDDVISLAQGLDALLLVAAADRTTAQDVVDAERMFGERVPLLGVALNKVEMVDAELYAYEADGVVA